MPKIVTEKDFLELSKGVDKELINSSFNKQTTSPETANLIIVGTLTPPDTSYFYCSYLNRIYGYIDEALKQLHRNGKETLKELKVGLSYFKSKKKTINLLPKEEIEIRVNKIKSILKNNSIAFLDVMDKAIRRKKTSLDSDIKYFVLAEDDFKSINKNATIIANSKLAYDCLAQMHIEAIFLSQRFGKKEDWVDAIKTQYKGVN